MKRPPKEVFAGVEAEAAQTSPEFDRLGLRGTLAIVLAILAYFGPVRELVLMHVPGAPGMRTW